MFKLRVFAFFAGAFFSHYAIESYRLGHRVEAAIGALIFLGCVWFVWKGIVDWTKNNID